MTLIVASGTLEKNLLRSNVKVTLIAAASRRHFFDFSSQSIEFQLYSIIKWINDD
jgi:hypothetical protein